MLKLNKSNNENKAFQYFKCAKPLDFSSINLESLEGKCANYIYFNFKVYLKQGWLSVSIVFLILNEQTQ